MFPYNPQSTRERLDSYISQLQQMKEQIPMQQPTNLTQNFSLTPTPQTGIKYANSMDEVIKENVFVDTPFFSSDLSVVWIKNIKGDIKTFEMKEIVQKDEKDMIIENLQYQLNEMNKKIKELSESAKSDYANDDEPVESEESSSISKVRATKK